METDAPQSSVIDLLTHMFTGKPDSPPPMTFAQSIYQQARQWRLAKSFCEVLVAHGIAAEAHFLGSGRIQLEVAMGDEVETLTGHLSTITGTEVEALMQRACEAKGVDLNGKAP